MHDQEWLKTLVCPACKGELDLNEKNLSLDCPRCRLRYLIKDDIPIMLVEEAEPF